MGPNFWEPLGLDPIQKCAERVSNTCSDETEGCCGIIPCAYCVEWNPETGDTVTAYSEFATNGWTVTIAGVVWFASWQRNYDTNECEFVVTLDDVEIYRKSCYEGQSCRDSSDSAAATIDEVAGVITWTKYEPRPLEYIQDPDTNCTTYFCGTCDCTCEELCYSISNLELDTASGTLPQLAYSDCDGPSWGATITLGVDEYVLFAELVRDEYTGGCVFQASIDGEPLESVAVDDCRELSGSWDLEGGGSFSLSCKRCGCNPRTGCCPNLPETIYITLDLTATTDPPMPGICPTIRLYGTITMSLSVEGAAAIWQSVSSPLTGDSCGEIADPPPEFYAVASCGPTGISVSVGTNESATAGIIWQAFYAGCNGGILTACDPDVTQAFGGLTDCDNYGALSA